MPKETFWDSATAVEGDDSEPILTIAWGQNRILVNGIEVDDSGISRMIGTLRKARRQTNAKLIMIHGGAIVEYEEPILDAIVSPE